MTFPERRGEPAEPAPGWDEVAGICVTVHPTQEAAMEEARRLRGAGWIVPLLAAPSPPNADGVRTVATVYHPGTYESPGDIGYADAA